MYTDCKYLHYYTASLTVFTILFPMFALSGVLAYLLYRELEKEEKKKEKKGA